MAIEFLIQDGVGEKSHYEYGDDRNRITIGRAGGGCDVVFSEEQKLVSRQHLALDRKFDGVYEIDLRDNRYVEVDGKPAREGQALSGRHKVRLGGPKGPQFEVTVRQQVYADNTAPQKAMPDLRKKAQRNQRLGILAVLMVLVVGGVFSFFYSQEKAAFSEELLATIEKSVMVGAVKNVNTGAVEAVGTVWVVDQFMLATNAHVAAAMAREETHLQPIAIDSDGNQYEINGIRIHAAYFKFTDFWTKSKFAVEGLKGGSELQLVPGYDVALMTVDTSETLPPPLELASVEDAKNMGMGTKLGSIGYPTEFVAGSEINTIDPRPQLKFGTLAGQTTFFYMSGAKDYQQLLTHSLPLTGGGSGSPIFNSSGQVVGLANAVSFVPHVQGLRIPNAAQVNYGMRIDVLYDMLKGEDENKLYEYGEHWQAQANRLTTMHTLSAEMQIRKLKESANIVGDLIKVFDQSVELQPGTGTDKSLTYSYTIEEMVGGKHYALYAISDDGVDVDTFLWTPNNLLLLSERSVATNSILWLTLNGNAANLRLEVKAPPLPEGQSELPTVKVRVYREP